MVYVYVVTIQPLMSEPCGGWRLKNLILHRIQTEKMWIINNNERVFEREQENVASPGINEGGSVDRWWRTSDSKDEDYVVASLESDSSFHSNSSNMDITDEIITNHKQQGVKTKAGAEKGKTKDKGATQVQIGVEKRSMLHTRVKIGVEKRSMLHTRVKMLLVQIRVLLQLLLKVKGRKRLG